MKHHGRTGRPRVDDTDESVPVCLVLPSRQYDALYRRAAERHVSVPEQIRRDLRPRRAPKKYPK